MRWHFLADPLLTMMRQWREIIGKPFAGSVDRQGMRAARSFGGVGCVSIPGLQLRGTCGTLRVGVWTEATRRSLGTFGMA